MNSKSFGKKLRAYRSKRGWSLKECSEKMGISTRYLADIERGDKLPKLETFIQMLNVLSASADDVLQDSLTVGYEAKKQRYTKSAGNAGRTPPKAGVGYFRECNCCFKIAK